MGEAVIHHIMSEYDIDEEDALKHVHMWIKDYNDYKQTMAENEENEENDCADPLWPSVSEHLMRRPISVEVWPSDDENASEEQLTKEDLLLKLEEDIESVDEQTELKAKEAELPKDVAKWWTLPDVKEVAKESKEVPPKWSMRWKTRKEAKELPKEAKELPKEAKELPKEVAKEVPKEQEELPKEVAKEVPKEAKEAKEVPKEAKEVPMVWGLDAQKSNHISLKTGFSRTWTKALLKEQEEVPKELPAKDSIIRKNGNVELLEEFKEDLQLPKEVTNELPPKMLTKKKKKLEQLTKEMQPTREWVKAQERAQEQKVKAQEQKKVDEWVKAQEKKMITANGLLEKEITFLKKGRDRATQSKAKHAETVEDLEQKKEVLEYKVHRLRSTFGSEELL
jgi:hypothetical protein